MGLGLVQVPVALATFVAIAVPPVPSGITSRPAASSWGTKYENVITTSESLPVPSTWLNCRVSVPPGTVVLGVATGVTVVAPLPVAVTSDTNCTLPGRTSASWRFVTVWPGATAMLTV